MNSKLLFRVVSISLHIFLNFILISYLMSFDWTGSWLRFSLFIFVLLALIALFVLHFVHFILFLKSRS